MGKVKVVQIIDTGCRKQIVLEDGRALDVRKEACIVHPSEEAAKEFADQVDKQLAEWSPCVKDTITITGGVMYGGVKEGDEVEV